MTRAHWLLQRRRPREAELHQAAKLFELLPQKPNDLWQMDVTYIHIPGYGWWYAVTVIDYYSRYLLACHLTHSYRAAEAAHALKLARQLAELLCGPLTKPPFLVTDNGSSFIARKFSAFVADQFRHARIRYRTPTQLGLLERFHRTLKTEEAYWRLYDHPQHARQCLAEFRDRYNARRTDWRASPKRVAIRWFPKRSTSMAERFRFPVGKPGRRQPRRSWRNCWQHEEGRADGRHPWPVSPASCRRPGGRGPSPWTPYPLLHSSLFLTRVPYARPIRRLSQNRPKKFQLNPVPRQARLRARGR